MPRGKNYVNQNKGMCLQAPKKEAVVEQCRYGKACQRPDCIYSHDGVEAQSNDPCLMFIAGHCHFDDKTCKKRHPSSHEEIIKLRSKYSKIPCRFGKQCQTQHCLYLHDLPERPQQRNWQTPPPPPTLAAFPPLGADIHTGSTNASAEAPSHGAPQHYPQHYQVPSPFVPQHHRSMPYTTQPSPYHSNGTYQSMPSMLRPELPGIRSQSSQQPQRPEPPSIRPVPSQPTQQSWNASAKEFVPGKGFS